MKKTIFITGSTDGIGKLAAIKLAKEGHEIFLHGRNQDKLKLAISEVKAQSQNENIKGYLADFTDLDSIKEMARQMNNEQSHIDILINNAGVFKSNRSQNKDGLDVRFVVNYLAPCLLTDELMPLLKKGNEARIINLSSAAQSPVSHLALTGKQQISVNESYAQSKLALSMWSFWLSEKQKDMVIIAVNPGSLLNTKMAKEAYGTHWSSADKGANILYELAISEKHKEMTGQYFDNDAGSYSQAHPDAYNETLIQNLNEITNNIIKGN